jgi:hypothetical protein
MALTLPGSPYVESSDLVANYPAVSESLAERVDLVGVLPFADSAARTTAIPTPTDGQYSYLQDTNATEYYNGTAWVAAGVAPGLVHINTTTFSAVSTLSLNSVFSAAYDTYEIQVRLDSVSAANPQLQMRLRASGTDATTNYLGFRLIQSSTTVQGSDNILGSTLWFLAQNSSTRATLVSATINSPFRAEKTVMVSHDSGSFNEFFGNHHSTASSYDGFTFLTDTGTMTGTVRVYGYKNS